MASPEMSHSVSEEVREARAAARGLRESCGNKVRAVGMQLGPRPSWGKGWVLVICALKQLLLYYSWGCLRY